MMNEEKQRQVMSLWKEVYVAYYTSTRGGICSSPHDAAAAADLAIEAFIKRFYTEESDGTFS
jgi:hypothetical protein